MPEQGHCELRLPLMGEGVREATVVKWLHRVGEKVKANEPLVEVSTDKVDTELPAPASGYLVAIAAPEGGVTEVDAVMAYIADDPSWRPDASLLQKSSVVAKPQGATAGLTRNERVSHVPPAGTALQGGRLAAPQLQAFAGYIPASPLARSLAASYGVSLGQVKGSGLHGRITSDDVVAYAESMAGTAAPQQPGVVPLLATTWQGDLELLEGVAVRREKMAKIRAITAERMSASVRTSPHVTTTFEIDLSRVRSAKERLGKDVERDFGCKLTYTAFFIEAALRAIEKFPLLNAAVDGDEILHREEINIGCAVAIETGLVVPVLRGLRGAKIGPIAQRLAELVGKARDKKLMPADLQGGTFSITNPGMFGSLHSQPIINQPQVAIMSIGAMVERAVRSKDGGVAWAPMCQVGLTFDHRLIDGEGGAKFLAEVKSFLESY